MKNLFRILFATVLFGALFMVSCTKDDEEEVPPVENKNFATLKTYLTTNDMDLPKVLDGWITTAAVVYAADTSADPSDDFYVIDIRSAADFTTGHIENSVNSTLADIVTTAGGNGGKPIIVVCYTGQGAGHGVVALRLSGFPTAKVMKWGMSGWNGNNDSWTPNVGDAAVTSGQWEPPTGDLGTLVNYGDPVIESSAADGAALLTERVTAMLAGGFKGITNADVFADPSSYFINNYWALTDVEHYGHIKGAVRVNPLSLAGEEYQNYNPSVTAVTYCWTGQTSSMITAYMSVIGYDAKSLKFGANGMIHTALTSHKWTSTSAKNYPLVP